MTTLIKAAGVQEVEPIWSTLFAKVRDFEIKEWTRVDNEQALEGKDVKDMLLNVGSGGGAAAAPAAGGAAAASGGAAEAAPAKEEEKEEGTVTRFSIAKTLLTLRTEKEESDEDMGFGLFD